MEQEPKTPLDFKRARRICSLIFDEFSSEDILVVDASHRIVDANNAPLKKYGLDRDAVIGRPCFEIFHHRKAPNDSPRLVCPLQEVIKTGKDFRCVHVHLDTEGGKIILSISAYPVYEQGKVAGVVMFSRDITWESSLQKSFGDQEKLAAIGRLAAGVAHEINNPLTTILTSAMLIQEDMDPENPSCEELELISRESLRCREIVSSLLDFARQSKPQKSAQDINQIVKDCVTLIRKHADFKNIAMTRQLGPEEILVCCDKSQILQCLVNLGLNAVDATSPGGRIVFSTREAPESHMAEITVSDTGHGIPEDMLDKIFEPFFTTKEAGTGLGLAISHGFVRQHKGSASVESKEGQGAKFIIRLPLLCKE